MTSHRAICVLMQNNGSATNPRPGGLDREQVPCKHEYVRANELIMNLWKHSLSTLKMPNIAVSMSCLHSLRRGLLLPSDNFTDQARLPDEPIVMQFPFLCGIRQLEIKSPQQLWHQLGYLQQGHVLSQAGPRSPTKLMVR